MINYIIMKYYDCNLFKNNMNISFDSGDDFGQVEKKIKKLYL